MFTYRVN